MVYFVAVKRNIILLGQETLTIDKCVALMKKQARVVLSKDQKQKIQNTRFRLEKNLHQKQSIYGVNTGFGNLKNIAIDENKLDELQINLIRSHCVGVGECLNEETVRLLMLLRANVLAKNYSGIRPIWIERLIQCLNNNWIAQIPSVGSVGASGDLAPLAHLALCLMGEGDFLVNGKKIRGEKLFKNKTQFKAKEALSLINGTQLIQAHAVVALNQASTLFQSSVLLAALSMDAYRASLSPFDARLLALKPHQGQIKVGRWITRLLKSSAILKSHAKCDRVQDPYSFRCIPQVYGSVLDAIEFVQKTVETEINSVTDNPIYFANSNEFISGGNFHGQAIASAMDFLAFSLCNLVSMSERRVYRLLSPDGDQRPLALVQNAGLQSGLMMLQVTQAALVNECKALAYPGSCDSIPTFMDQEDHVSMGPFAARKLLMILNNVSYVLAIEALVAAQALDFLRPLRSSKAIESVFDWIRIKSPRVTKDRVLSNDLQVLAFELSEGRLLAIKNLSSFFNGP